MISGRIIRGPSGFLTGCHVPEVPETRCAHWTCACCFAPLPAYWPVKEQSDQETAVMPEKVDRAAISAACRR